MKKRHESSQKHLSHKAPGEIRDGVKKAVIVYATGLAIAAVLTILSFWVATSGHVWGPSIIMWLSILAIAQVGVHLLFFLHLSTDPDNVDNLMIVIFGAIIILLFGVGTLFVMENLNSNMQMSMPMDGNMDDLMDR